MNEMNFDFIYKIFRNNHLTLWRLKQTDQQFDKKTIVQLIGFEHEAVAKKIEIEHLIISFHAMVLSLRFVNSDIKERSFVLMNI
jgi:hypothetical protein